VSDISSSPPLRNYDRIASERDRERRLIAALRYVGLRITEGSGDRWVIHRDPDHGATLVLNVTELARALEHIR